MDKWTCFCNVSYNRHGYSEATHAYLYETRITSTIRNPCVQCSYTLREDRLADGDGKAFVVMKNVSCSTHGHRCLASISDGLPSSRLAAATITVGEAIATEMCRISCSMVKRSRTFPAAGRNVADITEPDLRAYYDWGQRPWTLHLLISIPNGRVGFSVGALWQRG